MANANAVLYPSTESIPESEPPTLVWRQRVIAIPPRRRRQLRPFSVEPIVELCIEGRLMGTRKRRNGIPIRPKDTMRHTAEVLDVGRHRLLKWTKFGLTANQADVIAIMFGLHPCLTWNEWFTHAPSEEKELVKAEAVGGRPHPVTDLDHRLVELRQAGHSHRAIAAMMNAENIRTKRGDRIWHAQIVARHLYALRQGVAA